MRDLPLRARHSTPQLLTPSHPRATTDNDDLFLHSPFKPAEHDCPRIDSPTPVFTPFINRSSSQTLRTPVKESSGSLLSTNAVSIPSPPIRSTIGGTKRKSTNAYSTPLRQNTLTPLKIQPSPKSQSTQSDSVSLHRLAPLPAPRFATRTPHSKVDTDTGLHKQTATMTRLKLSEDRSSCETDDAGIFLDEQPLRLRRDASLGRKLGRHMAKSRAKALLDEDEVIESVSPGGHINKRRARSRPVSLELLDSVKSNPSTVMFPLATSPSRCSPSKLNLVHSRPRLSGMLSPTSGNILDPKPSTHARAPITRLESSATLFFGGPTIPVANKPRISTRHSYNGDGSLESFRSRKPSGFPNWDMRSRSRSPDSSPFSVPPDPDNRQLRSLFDADDDDDEFFTESSFNSTLPANSSFGDTSFVFKLTEGTPSPRGKNGFSRFMLEKKYKPRDSGIAMSDDDDILRLGFADSGYHLNVMPRASTSVNTISSDTDDAVALVTPGAEPGSNSGWPGIRVASYEHLGVESMDVDMEDGDDRVFDTRMDKRLDEIDAFIVKTLNAASKPGVVDATGRKAVPGTPVKKPKKGITGGRPWQSAVTNKVGLNYGVEPPGPGKKGKVPRKSLPAAFPVNPKQSSGWGDISDSDQEAEDSPSLPGGREGRYLGLGLGRPTTDNKQMPTLPTRTRWLMRRSSSGAFSSSSDLSLGTPTRGKDLARRQNPISPLTKATTSNLLLGKHNSPSARSVSSSSASSIVTLNSPTTSRATASQRCAPAPRKDSNEERQKDGPSRFERDFVQVDEVGSGEFGKVIKVRRRIDSVDGPVYALKKSKRFEGPRHRLRLREEVDILQHLSISATTEAAGGTGRHPNVLAYVDSWEDDDILYIQTELCECGNFSRFLWEYGKAYPRLDEGRVWKIMADLSSGIRFIHDAGVIHLDLKPANIFITAEGRFKIGDFGMASVWPRPATSSTAAGIDAADVVVGGFEREGDKLYMAPEILQGRYGSAADMFSFGMIMLETATNIVVPDQGEPWQRLRQEDFGQVEWEGSGELYGLIKSMMRHEPEQRVDAQWVYEHGVVRRAREEMERTRRVSSFAGSPLGFVRSGFVEKILWEW